MPRKTQINVETIVSMPVSEPEQVFSEDRVFLIHLAKILPSPFEPQARRRQKFIDSEIESLGDSIINQGLFSPIVVRRRNPNQFEIVFGERRYLAAKKKNLPTIKCFIRELSDAQVLENQYQENHQRGDNDPLDDAFLFKFLIEKEGYTEERLANRFAKPKREITEKLKLNDLIPEAVAELAGGQLPLRHAYYLAKFSATAQAEIVRLQLAYKYNDRNEMAISYHEFKQEVEESVIRNLSRAPFSTLDPRLHIKGLRCPDCPENSANETHLFPELATDPHCLNKPCFEVKTGTHLRLQREAIAAQKPNPANLPVEEMEKEVPLVTERKWTDERAPFKEKVLTDQKLLEKPECEFSELSLAVEGDKKGRQVYVCRNRAECPVHRPPVPDVTDTEAEKKEAEFERRVRAAVRETVLRRAMTSFDDYHPVWMFDDLVQRVIVELWFAAGGVATQKILQSVIKDWKNTPSAFYARREVEAFAAALDKTQQSQLIFLLISVGGTDELTTAKLCADYAKSDYLLLDAETRLDLAPDGFKSAAAEYVEAVRNGESAQPPRFWRDED